MFLGKGFWGSEKKFFEIIFSKIKYFKLYIKFQIFHLNFSKYLFTFEKNILSFYFFILRNIVSIPSLIFFCNEFEKSLILYFFLNYFFGFRFNVSYYIYHITSARDPGSKYNVDYVPKPNIKLQIYILHHIIVFAINNFFL
jgi:hypothetical protein